MTVPVPLETEIKLPVPDLEALARSLRAAGFRDLSPAQPEISVLWDRDGELRARGEAIRIRAYDGQTRLTWKGPRLEDPRFKVRPEAETGVEDRESLEAILRALGLAPVFEMTKQRAVLRDATLVACLDETPFGCFLELEGPREAIQSTLVRLGLAAVPPETRSYPALFRAWREGS